MDSVEGEERFFDDEFNLLTLDQGPRTAGARFAKVFLTKQSQPCENLLDLRKTISAMEGKLWTPLSDELYLRRAAQALYFSPPGL